MVGQKPKRRPDEQQDQKGGMAIVQGRTDGAGMEQTVEMETGLESAMNGPVAWFFADIER
ncbi:MAG: hypothetical protein ACFB6R_03420 [Alphaproteobacteria bacterium]